MMIETQDKAYEFFVQESLELLQILEQGLMSLTQDHDLQKLHGLMRAAHSIKGGAACVGLLDIQQVAHQLENGIRALYSEDIVFDLELEELFLQAFDCLKIPIIQQIETDDYDENQIQFQAQVIFTKLENKLGHSLEEATELPEIPIQTDMTQFLFEKEIPSGLRRLQELLNSRPQNLYEELKTQMEVLMTLASMLNLPGFTKIAETATEALEINPDACLKIGELALIDFWAGHQKVLEGDRTQGGEPSDTLIQLTKPGDPVTITPQTIVHDQDKNPLTQAGDPVTITLENIVHDQDENPFYSPENSLLLQPLETLPLPTPIELSLSELVLKGFEQLQLLLLETIETHNFPDKQANSTIEEQLIQIESKLGFALSEAAESQNFSRISQLDLIDETTQKSSLKSNDCITELKTQIEMFVPVGQMLNLPELNAITQTTLQAFKAKPECYLAIGVVALADFWRVYQALLAGEDTSEEKSSEVLIQFTQSNAQEHPDHSSDLVLDSNNQSSVTVPFSQTSQSVSNNTNKSVLSLGVRVDVKRLNLINNLVGELATQDNSFLLQNQQSKTAIEKLDLLRDNSRKRLIKAQNYTDFYPDQADFLNPIEMQRSAQALNRLIQNTLEELDQIREVAYDLKWQNLQSQQVIQKRQQTLQKVQQQLMETRMLSMESLLNRFPRTIRDLSIQNNKPVQLELIGKNTLVDKAVLEKLYDPLVHLIRNAFDHGIEPPELRKEQDKPLEGKIEIRAYQQGNYTYIEVKDDGQGIDVEKIRNQATAKGFVSEQDSKNLSQNQCYDFLFYPDFSTRDRVSYLSGRGVGLEAVRRQIEALKGSISIQSELGKGTQFTLRLPWTLTMTKLLVFQIAGNLFAIPLDTLAGIVSASPKEIEIQEGQAAYNWYGQSIPLVQSMLLNYHYPVHPSSVSKPTNFEKNSLALEQSSPPVMLLLVSQGLETISLKIDRVLMEQNLTIKPFNKMIAAPSYFYGCTLLGDGRLVPVLDSPELLRHWLQKQQSSSVPLRRFPPQESPKPVHQGTTLVIDDSLTTRQSLCAMLQKSGYSVVQAHNGREGLDKLKQNSQIQIVICDLEMPEMNGFEFLTHCRRQFSEEVLPVLILTSRNNDRHRQLAQQLGSNHYLTKPWNETELIQLLQEYMKKNQGSTLGNRP